LRKKKIKKSTGTNRDRRTKDFLTWAETKNPILFLSIKSLVLVKEKGGRRPLPAFVVIGLICVTCCYMGWKKKFLNTVEKNLKRASP